MDDQRGFTEIRDRLEAIDGEVRGDLSLDAALELYDEAVRLSMQASDLLEQLSGADDDAEEQGEAQGEGPRDAEARGEAPEPASDASSVSIDQSEGRDGDARP